MEDEGLSDSGAHSIRVAFVLHVMQVAGAEVLVAETIRRLAGRIEPTVLCLDGVGTLGERLLVEGIPVVCLGRLPGHDWRVVWRMAGQVRARRIEVIHAHQYTPFFYAALAKVASGRLPRVILTEHGRHYPDVVSPARRLANQIVFDRLADSITGVCDFSLRSLCEVDGFSRGRVQVIENGIDLDRYGPPPDRAALRGRLGLDAGRRYLVNIARHHPVKDQETLLRGFREVVAARADVDLLLVGDGPLRGKLEDLADRLGVAARVRFLGVRTDVPEVLRAANIFVLTSLSEAASLTLMEAMATGLPVVVTNVGGNPELVRDGVEGHLVPRGDAGATAAAILRLLDDPAGAAAMGAAGRARAEERYRLDRTIDAYMDLYQRLTRRGGRGSNDVVGARLEPRR
jgi:glycosyltransferase involved in cell wall biosynthesis